MKPAARTSDELLQRARDQAEPDGGEAGRVLARLRAQLPPSGAAGALSSARLEAQRVTSEPPRVARMARRGLTPGLRRSLLGAAGVALFGAGFLLGRLSSAPRDATTSTRHAAAVAAASETLERIALPTDPGESQPAEHVAAEPEPAERDTAEPEPAERDTAKPDTAEPESVLGAAPPASIDPIPRASAHRVRQRAPARELATTSAAAANEPLKEALRRLRRAQRALYDKDAERALAVLDDLNRRIPPAVLGEEREMTRILALCGTAERDEARALARRWLGEHPQSIYLTRLQDSCVDGDDVAGEPSP
ncbi:MAG TPA: hypothetical protein VMG12_40625 [Polyangiaceae bacterium]|nr:hypothetical protein [Polyangiaceae bacterium]